MAVASGVPSMCCSRPSSSAASLAGRAPRRRERRLGLRVASARNHRARPDGDDVGIPGVELVGQRVDLVVLALDECAICQLQRREQRGRSTARRLRRPEGREREHGERGDEEEKGKRRIACRIRDRATRRGWRAEAPPPLFV
jgi:hypothetical protein